MRYRKDCLDEKILDALYEGEGVLELALRMPVPLREIYSIRNAEIGRLYRNNLPLSDLADMFDITKTRVWQILMGLKIERRPRGRPRNDYNSYGKGGNLYMDRETAGRTDRRRTVNDYWVIFRKYQDGDTQEEVAEELGISQKRVSQILRNSRQ